MDVSAPIGSATLVLGPADADGQRQVQVRVAAPQAWGSGLIALQVAGGEPHDLRWVGDRFAGTVAWPASPSGRVEVVTLAITPAEAGASDEGGTQRFTVPATAWDGSLVEDAKPVGRPAQVWLAITLAALVVIVPTLWWLWCLRLPQRERVRSDQGRAVEVGRAQAAPGSL